MRRDDVLKQRLVQAGLDADVAEAALEVDGIVQRWRRRAMRREVESRAVAELGLDLDVARLDVLMAIWAPSAEFGPPDDPETMVGTVAQRLGIDPSRASRLIGEVIDSGHARRAVSQRDARRTVVLLTEKGEAAVTEMRAYKIQRVAEFLSDWTPEDIATFLPLLERFSAWSVGRAAPPEAIPTQQGGAGRPQEAPGR